MNLPKRKHPRLKNYDYSQNGYYFITICTQDHKKLLGSIHLPDDPQALPDNTLSEYGRITETYIKSIENAYRNVYVEKYVIMPNHVHLILVLYSDKDTEPAPSIQTVIHGFKSLTTKKIGFPIWQESFYEHIIRNDAAYREIWTYIDDNPRRWLEDRYNL